MQPLSSQATIAMQYKQTVSISYKTALLFFLIIAVATVALILILYHTIRARTYHIPPPMKKITPWLITISLDLPLLAPATLVQKIFKEKRNLFKQSLQNEVQPHLQLSEKDLCAHILKSVIGELGHFTDKQYALDEILELFPDNPTLQKACTEAKEKIMEPYKKAAERGKKK